MAIAFDASSSSTTGGATSLTWAQTNTGTNLMLVTGVLTNDTTDKVTGVTYNSVAMTRKLAYQAVTTNFFGFIYVLPGPATGANNVVISRSDSGLLGGMASSYTGVNQSTTLDSSASGTDATGNFSATTTVVASNCWLVANVRSNNSTSGITAGTGTTSRQTVFTSAGMLADSNTTVSTGSQSLNFNANPGGETYWGIISIAPPPSGPANVKTVNGLALASVKTINGLAIASVKTINGLA